MEASNSESSVSLTWDHTVCQQTYCPVLITSFHGFVWPMHLAEFYLNNNWIHDTETYRKIVQNIQCQSMTYLLRYSQFFSNLVRPCHDSTVVSKFWQQLVMACSE